MCTQKSKGTTSTSMKSTGYSLHGMGLKIRLGIQLVVHIDYISIVVVRISVVQLDCTGR